MTVARKEPLLSSRTAPARFRRKEQLVGPGLDRVLPQFPSSRRSVPSRYQHPLRLHFGSGLHPERPAQVELAHRRVPYEAESLRDRLRASGQQLLDHLSADVGEAKVATLEAVRELRVVHAEEVQQGGVEV